MGRGKASRDERSLGYRFFSDAAKEFMTFINRQYVYEVANRVYCAAHGKTQEEIVGKTVAEIWGQEVFGGIIRGYLDECFGGKEVHYEEWFEFDSQGKRCYSVSYYPYPGKDGEITHAMVISHDVTRHKELERMLKNERNELEARVLERTEELLAANNRLKQEVTDKKLAEKTLLISQHRLRAILDNIPDIAWLKDRESRFIAVNEAFGNACGFKPIDIIGKTDIDIWPKCLAERYRADDREVMLTGRRKQVEEPLIDSKSEEIWIDTIKTPIFNEKGVIVGTAGIARDMTARRTMEEALRVSEQLYRTVIESSKDGIAIMQGDSYVFVNRSFVEIFGYNSENDVIGKPISFNIHPDDYEMVVGMNRCRRYGERANTSYEFKGIKRDGGVVYIDVSVASITHRGKPASLAFLRDVTERKKNERVLMENMQQIRQAKMEWETTVDSLAKIVCLLDGNGNIVRTNKIMERWGLGNTKRIVGKNIHNILHPDCTDPACCVASFFENANAVLKKMGNTGIEVNDPILKRYVNIQIRKIMGRKINKTTNIESVAVLTIEDISSKKKAEEILRRSEKHFRSLIENVPDSIVVVNIAGLILYESPSIKYLLGYKPREMKGKNILDYIHHEDKPAIRIGLNKPFMKHGGIDTVVLRTMHQNGTWRFLECTWRNLINEQSVAGIVISMRDITERKEIEDKLRRAYDELKQTQQELLQADRLAMLGKFSSGIAHEIRNPIANISATAQFFISKYKPTGDMLRHLEVILRNSVNANKIIKELLNLARPSVFSSGLGQIGEIIDRSCELVKTRCEQQHILLHKRWPRKLPLVLFDGERMEKTFLNIIVNAMDAMPKGGRLAVTAYYDLQDKKVVISFLDTGIGMRPEDMEKALHPFFTTKKEGIGLGLCLAQQVINYHKGTIAIKSSIGEGTEVIVRLPAQEKTV